VHDDPEDLNKNIDFMKSELVNQNVDLDQVTSSWKITFVQRRTFVRDHTTKEVLQEYPGYGYASLVCSSLSFIRL
jgi:hypothetical protein